MANNVRFPIAESERDDGVPSELAELGRIVDSIPGTHHPELGLAFSRVVDSVRRRRRILVLVQEALSQLRLDIKYLMFDLEVTRQERDELRQQLEDR